MELELNRFYYVPDEVTIGKLLIDGKYFCHTLEDPRRNAKIFGETCIWPGRFLIKPRFSPMLQVWVPWLQEVPDFTYVYLHAGNTAKQTDGCILVGSWRSDVPLRLFNSTLAFNQLKAHIWDEVEDGSCWITVNDGAGWGDSGD